MGSYYNIMDQTTTTVQYKFSDTLAQWPKLPVLPQTPGDLPLMERPTVRENTPTQTPTQTPQTIFGNFLKTVGLKK